MDNPNTAITIDIIDIEQWLRCPRRLRYERARIRPKQVTNSELFNTCLREAIVRKLLDRNEEDMGVLFQKIWKQSLSEKEVIFPSQHQNPELHEQAGIQLCKGFERAMSVYPLYIEAKNYHSKLKLSQGALLAVPVDIIAVATRDIFDPVSNECIVESGGTLVICLNAKTQEHSTAYSHSNHRLSYQWLAAEQYAKDHGMSPPSACAFLTGLKTVSNASSATFSPMTFVPRSQSQLSEALAVASRCASDVVNQFLPRMPSSSYEGGCDESSNPCGYVSHCIFGDSSLVGELSNSQLIAIS